jgi:hypothetical protein
MIGGPWLPGVASDEETRMRLRGIQAGWSDQLLPLHSHVCFYYSDDATLRRSLSFLRVGLDVPDELCMLFADPHEQAALLALIQEGYAGHVSERMDEGKLAVLSPSPTRQEVAVELSACLEGGLAAGFTAIRLLGYPGFNRPGWPSTDEILSLEDDCNEVAAAYPAVIVCAYGPGVESDVMARQLRLHPGVWVHGQVERNPLYRQPAGSALQSEAPREA